MYSGKEKKFIFNFFFFQMFFESHLNEDKNFGEEIATFANIESAITFL
jgi:hypothetical protein